jgi:hypothetical protein
VIEQPIGSDLRFAIAELSPGAAEIFAPSKRSFAAQTCRWTKDSEGWLTACAACDSDFTAGIAYTASLKRTPFPFSILHATGPIRAQ